MKKLTDGVISFEVCDRKSSAEDGCLVVRTLPPNDGRDEELDSGALAEVVLHCKPATVQEVLVIRTGHSGPHKHQLKVINLYLKRTNGNILQGWCTLASPNLYLAPYHLRVANNRTLLNFLMHA